MKDFKLYKLNQEDIEKIKEYKTEEDVILLNILPEKGDAGINTMQDLYETFHIPETKPGRFSETNNSSEYGLEMWYSGGTTKFFLKADMDKEKDIDHVRHLRKQVDKSMSGVQIESQLSSFPDMHTDYYVTGGELRLKRHFFDPIESSVRDPYKKMLAEVEAKEDNFFLYQVLFKPALKGWDTTPTKTIHEHANMMSNSDSEEIQNSSSNVRNRAGKKAYHVNIRFIMGSTNKDHLKQDVAHFEDIYRKTYKNGPQELIPVPPRNKKKLHSLIRNFIVRKGTKMNQLNGRLDSLKTRLADYIPMQFFRKELNQRIIMTTEELAAVAHVPDSDMGIKNIEWNILPSGNVPSTIENFRGYEDEKKQEMKEDLMEKRKEMREKMRKELGKD